MFRLIQVLLRVVGLVIIFFTIFQISEYGEKFLEKELGFSLTNKNFRIAFDIQDQIGDENIELEENDKPLFSILDVPAFLFIIFLLIGFFLLSLEISYFFAIIKQGLFLSPSKIESATNLLIKNLKAMSDNFYLGGASSLKASSKIKKYMPVWPLLIEQIELKLPFEDIIHMLGNSAALSRKKYDRLIKIVNNISNIAPSLGVIGTVLGLIKLLFNLRDPSSLGSDMALALMTTFYGLFFSVIVLKPLVMRLESNKMAELNAYQHAIFWLSILQDRKPSFYLEQRFDR